MIEQLPEDWSAEVEAEGAEQAARYKELQTKLAELNGKRKAARERLEQYRAAKKLLAPFEGEEAGLQDNLLTRNGEIEMELERMRMLMLRVERGLQGLDEGQHVGDDEMAIDVEEEGEKKILAVLQTT
jgi:hypothetical protein